MSASGTPLSLGDAIDRALQDKRWTQQKLAEELRIDPAQVSRWKRGRTVPHRSMVSQIESLLGVDLSPSFNRAVPEFELFISAPITGLKDSDLFTHHGVVSEVVTAAERIANGVFWPGRDISSRDDLLAPNIATARNMAVLGQCSALLYLQFAEIEGPSSSLVELGIALGRRLKTTLLLAPGIRTPYMFENFGSVAASLPHLLPEATIYTKQSDEAPNFIDKNGRGLLGLA